MYHTDKIGCQFIELNLAHVMFREVDEETYRKSMEHIDMCSGCRERHREYLTLLFKIRRFPGRTPSPDMYFRLRNDVRNRFSNNGKVRITGFLKTILMKPVIAYGLLSILTLFVLFRGQGDVGIPPGTAVQASIQLTFLDGRPLADTLHLASNAIDTLLSGGRALDSTIKDLLSSLTFEKCLVRKIQGAGIGISITAKNQSADGSPFWRYFNELLPNPAGIIRMSGFSGYDSIDYLIGGRSLPAVNMPADALYANIREL